MSQGRLKEKVALITGGGAGIGAATAHLFCREGAKVILVDLNALSLKNTKELLEHSIPGAQVETVIGDVSDEAVASLAVNQGLKRFGQLDILVNNAAMRNYDAIAEASVKDWQAIVGVNLIGTANFAKAALPALRLSGKGAIINVSSCYAVVGRQGMGLYDATKAGQLALTRTLAFEEAKYGVRVNTVCPGSTLTDFHVGRAKNAGKDVETLKTERQTTSLIGRWADPTEIAAPILWLASDEASFITGTSLMVDGGLSIM
jgi:2-hydroxycyclohexanecarboxyl-CoA dehydrogenase